MAESGTPLNFVSIDAMISEKRDNNREGRVRFEIPGMKEPAYFHPRDATQIGVGLIKCANAVELASSVTDPPATLALEDSSGDREGG